VKQRAFQYGIDEKGYGDENASVIAGRVLSADEKRQRRLFVDEIKKHGYNQAVEEVAYTWFNRFVALRYMEVNDFLPTHIRVFSDASGNFNPEILANVLHLDLPGLDKVKVSEYLNGNQTEELYRYLLLTQCNALNELLPEMFERMGAYTEMLLPNNILKPDSVIGRMVKDIPEEDFNTTALNEDGVPNGQVEILGWLYQHYISDPKDVLINAKKKYKKEDIPFVTQIFTSDWIVKYIVDNSLGRYWIERNPESKLREKLEFFVTPKSGEIEYINEKVNPETITFFDPCMGSGHILIYAFDVFMEIYKECGYSERDAAQSIIQNNLFGVDIDERAYQYAYFAIMMKARSYDRRFLTRNLEPKLSIIEESNEIKSYTFEGITYDKDLDKIGEYLCAVFKDAKEIGSLQTVEKENYQDYLGYLNNFKMEGQMSFDSAEWYKDSLPTLKALAKQAGILAEKYTIVCTNPPYMPNNKMSTKLKAFIENEYKSYKGKTYDAFFAFIIKCIEYTDDQGYIGMLTPFVWMFISSYEKLRKYILSNSNITTLVQLEYNAFESACVPVCSFVLEKTRSRINGEYIKLSEFKGVEIQPLKTREAIYDQSCGYRYSISQLDFEKIPGNPIAYWAGSRVFDLFEYPNIGTKLTTREGMATAGNDIFLRLWFEVNISNIGFGFDGGDEAKESQLRWFPYNKGGDFRKWYGNNEYVVDWENDGVRIKNNIDHESGRIRSHNYNDAYGFVEGIGWSALSSDKISVRYYENGYLFDSKGPKAFTNDKAKLLYFQGLINSIVGSTFLKFLSPTIDFKVGDIIQIPYIYMENSEIIKLVNDNIIISKSDWDSFETSWDFSESPLIKGNTIRESFEIWKKECEHDFIKLKSNEEELNRIFIEIYGLQDELTPEVEDKDITLNTNTAYRYKQKKKKSNGNEYEPEEETVEAKEIRDQRFLRDTITEFISYAVGCMFGRYSLDAEGLAYAGGVWDETKYSSFIPDKDNIIPICDDEYFDDDITGRFIEFIKTVYDEKSLDDNLNFIADALGGKGSSREIIRNYFINDFFKDHCNMYTSRGAGKRPIYWLFDSGKKNGFKALIYMHRYSRDLLAKLRTDYVHEQQERYRTQLSHITSALNTASGAERAKLLKQQDKLTEQLREITDFEEKVHHLADQNIMIDLDGGVKKNYEIFADVLAKI
jgi:hypothetical protein